MPLDENPSFDPSQNEPGELFTAGNDGQSRACLNFLDDQWDLYALGFKTAADMLVERLQENNSHIDAIVYPICFLYRQYLELRLKEIIKSGYDLLDEPQKFQPTHNLVRLWEDAREPIGRIFQEEDQSSLTAIDSVVEQFSKIDAHSFSFRYPVDKKDSPSLPGVKYINVVDLKNEIDKAELILEGISIGVSVYIDHKDDMKREFSGFE